MEINTLYAACVWILLRSANYRFQLARDLMVLRYITTGEF